MKADTDHGFTARISPAELASASRAIERGRAIVLPLEACLLYGGPVRVAVQALARRSELRLSSPYLAAVARGERVHDPVHAAEFQRFLLEHRPAEIRLPGVSTEAAETFAASLGWSGPLWSGNEDLSSPRFFSDDPGVDPGKRAAELMKQIYPAFRASLSTAQASDLARALARDESWAIASEHWGEWSAAGSLPTFLRSARARESVGVTAAQFEIARREWVRFECLFHPADEGEERARLAPDEARLNPAASTFALGAGRSVSALWAVARNSANELIERALGWQEAALLDELGEAQRLPVESLISGTEAAFALRPPPEPGARDFRAALDRLRDSSLVWVGKAPFR